MNSAAAKQKRPRAVLQSLQTYQEPYVTIGQLARYWLVSRKQLYKQIEAGTLPAIRLGPRLLRIRTSDALAFETSAKMHPPAESQHAAEASDHYLKHSTARRRQR